MSKRRRPEDQLLKVQEEIADVFLYLVRLADKLGIDMLAAASTKMELNANKYPVAKARGSMKKYTDF
jgi:NTP pyrophosphatase (non-canonical NTP hydrolase)